MYFPLLPTFLLLTNMEAKPWLLVAGGFLNQLKTICFFMCPEEIITLMDEVYLALSHSICR